MDREQLIKELKLLDDGDLEPTYERIADYFLSHTEELRKENEKEKLAHTEEERSLRELAKINSDIRYKFEQENDRLKALVDTINCIAGKPYDFSGKTDMWKVAGDLSDDCQDIMDKIAEFKEGK